MQEREKEERSEQMCRIRLSWIARLYCLLSTEPSNNREENIRCIHTKLY